MHLLVPHGGRAARRALPLPPGIEDMSEDPADNLKAQVEAVLRVNPQDG
jgi:hypothetical protein